MSGLRITFSDERLARALSEVPEELAREVDRALGRAALEVSRSARRKAPKAFSTLTNSIGVERPSRLEAVVAPHVDYAAAVEEGTGPGGSPPLRSIRDWIQVQGISPANPADDLDDLARRIVHKIRRQGTPAQPFMEPAFREQRPNVLRRLDAAVEKVLRAV